MKLVSLVSVKRAKGLVNPPVALVESPNVDELVLVPDEHDKVSHRLAVQSLLVGVDVLDELLVRAHVFAHAVGFDVVRLQLDDVVSA